MYKNCSFRIEWTNCLSIITVLQPLKAYYCTWLRLISHWVAERLSPLPDNYHFLRPHVAIDSMWPKPRRNMREPSLNSGLPCLSNRLAHKMQIKLSEHLVLQQPKLSANELSQSLANKFTMLSSCEEGWRSEVMMVFRRGIHTAGPGMRKGKLLEWIRGINLS